MRQLEIPSTGVILEWQRQSIVPKTSRLMWLTVSYPIYSLDASFVNNVGNQVDDTGWVN